MVVWRNDVRHIHSFQWLQFGNSTKNTHFRERSHTKPVAKLSNFYFLMGVPVKSVGEKRGSSGFC